MSVIKINKEVLRTIPWRLVAIFLCFSVAIILSGILFYKSQRNRLFRQEKDDLTVIASLKVDQIEQWQNERLGDAAVIRDNEPLINRIKQYFSDEDKPGIKSELTNWMESVNNAYDYRGVLITDTDLKVRLSVPNSDTTAGDAIAEELKSVLRKGTMIITDLHRTNCINYIHIDILIPLIDRKGREEKIFGVMILRIDPEVKLFPLIQLWPTPSKSSETLLLRKEGDSVLYLNELRHQKNTALKLSLSLGDTSLLASKAAMGMKGVFEGIDYRKIPVVGYLTGIPDFPWFMVAKVDKEEIQGPVRRYFIISVIIVLLLILINASVLGFWIWNQQVRSYRSQLLNERSVRESEKKLKESEELFSKLFLNMLNGFAYCKMIYKEERPHDFIYLNVNAAFESLTGLKNVEGRKVSDVIPGIQSADPELFERYGRVARTGIPEVFETYVESLKMWFAISVYSPQKEYFVAVFDVITARKLAEETLRESENKLREAQEMAHLGFWKWDIKSGDVEWSEEVYKIFHLNPEEFTPQIDSILALSPWEEDHKRNTELINRAIATHEPGDYEQKFLRPDNSVGYYYSTFQGKYDKKGDLISIIGTILDITERKNAIEALVELSERQNAILTSVPDIIMEVDMNKVYTWANNSGYDFFGDDVIGKKADFYFEGEQDTYKVVKILFAGSEDNIYVESWQRRKDGEKRLLAWWCRVLKNEKGTVTGALSSALDITERVLAESEIRKLNEELESRVIQRTEQLEASNKELEAFSYSVSHDLRAPLRSVHGYTKILLEEYENKLDDEGKRICGIISSSATQMGELIDDLLSFSRIGRSSLNPVLLDMRSIVNSVFDNICSTEEKSGIKLKIGMLHETYGDASLIRLVWTNLISNAVKYSSKKNLSEISISSSLKDNSIAYSVKDNGVGFDMLYRHKLFGVFHRLHSGNEFEGNGVGLAIVQRIVLRHGGNVKAEGKVGEGATFCFSLPAQDNKITKK